jgi:solute carrier family 25 protein 38
MKGSTSASINFSSGMLAAGLATTITNPFDAIKTRIQLQPSRYRNMHHAVRMMVRDDGLKSLFDGLGLRMGRKAMSSALAWTLYEELIRRAELVWKSTHSEEGVL